MLRFLYVWASNAGGLPPLLPFALRRAIWSDFSGIVCGIRRFRSAVRVDGCEYALSARIRVLLPVRRRRRCVSSSGRSCGLSPACPPVSLTSTGLVAWSVSVWIFVDGPPRDRPRA